MEIEEIIKTLSEFAPFPEDDPVNDNETLLSNLMDQWKNTSNRQKAIPAIFHLIEKYPHTDFGSPGPLVHALEAEGVQQYEGVLQISLLRKPTPLTLWMYNRIINAEKDLRIKNAHLERLKLFSKHPFANDETKQVAKQFIVHQQE